MTKTKPFTIICLVHGDAPEHAFAVDVNKFKYVTHLEKLIKKTKTHIANDKVALWNINIPENDKAALRELVLKDDKANNIMKMSSGEKIGKYFHEKPSIGHIHVIIERLGKHLNSAA